MKDNNKLQVILNEQGIEKSDVAKLVEAFGGPFEEAGAILASYKDIKVTSETDVEGMAKARELRLILKKARTTVENSRKDLKADIVKQGRAIDSVARFVKEEIEPAEQYLEEQEKFAELRKAEREAKLKAERTEKLMAYTDDISLYNLDAMNDDQFDQLLATLKAQHEAKIAEAKRIENERIAKEKADAEEQERIRQENEKLKAEAQAREEAERKEREARQAEEAKAEADRQAEYKRLSSIKVDLLEYAHNIKTVEDADNQAKRLELYADSLDPADREHEMISAAYHKSKSEIVELKQFIIERDAKAEADRKAAEEAKAKADAEEAERKALLAPDKDKLIQFADGIEIVRTTKLPAVKSKQAQDIINEVELKLSQLFNYIKDEAGKL